MGNNISRRDFQAFLQLQDIFADFLEQLQIDGIGQRKSKLIRSRSLYRGFFNRFCDLAVGLLTQLLACTGDGKALVVKEVLQMQDQFYIPLAIKPLIAATLVWSYSFKLSLPVTEDVCLNAGEFGNFTDLVIKFVGNLKVHAPKPWRWRSGRALSLRVV